MLVEAISTSTESPTEAKSVAIFGGGIAGLTAAHEFAKLGYKVKVFEANADAGGFLEVPEGKKIRVCLLNTLGMEWALGITIFSNSSRRSPLMSIPVSMTTFFLGQSYSAWRLTQVRLTLVTFTPAMSMWKTCLV